jgi:hypothetical protein
MEEGTDGDAASKEDRARRGEREEKGAGRERKEESVYRIRAQRHDLWRRARRDGLWRRDLSHASTKSAARSGTSAPWLTAPITGSKFENTFS